ncbi:hypothetical protein [Roseibium sp. M-1]
MKPATSSPPVRQKILPGTNRFCSKRGLHFQVQTAFHFALPLAEDSPGRGRPTVCEINLPRIFWAEMHLLVRLADPFEIGAVALWFYAPVAHNVTGVTIPVDGGWTAQ